MRYVVAVAETGSFTRAAERCFVVQSALSHQIANLERELGVKLFARTSRRVELTQAGQAFLPAARQSLEAADRAAIEAAAAAGEVRGRLAIGVIPTVTAVDIPEALQRFHDRHPQVRIGIRVGSSDEMTAAVRDGRLDVAALGLPENDRPHGVRGYELASDPHVAVVASSHTLAGETQVCLDDLTDETFVDFPAGGPGREQSDRAFAAAGLNRHVAFELMDPRLILQLVERGLAVALLPPGVVGHHPGVATVPVRDGPCRVEHLVWSDFNPSPAARAFLATLPIPLDDPGGSGTAV